MMLETNNVCVSVIIPFYGHVEWLNEAVESVFIQTFNDYEVIVINDGSPEDVSIFLSKYRKRIIYHKKENGGPASARNCGIEKARGKYIAFLDSDDIWEKNKLEIQVGIMEKTGSIWSHTSYSLFGNLRYGFEYRKIDLSYFNGKVFPQCLASSPIATPCVMIKSDFLSEHPAIRFNEDMRYGQDWFMWINLAIEEPLLVIPKVLTRVRIRGSNAALRAEVQLKARSQIWTFLKKNPGMFSEKEPLGFAMELAYRMCSAGYRIVKQMESGCIRNQKTLELISKFVYVFPYLIFKSINWANFRKQASNNN